MIAVFAPLAILLAAFWDAWRWCVERAVAEPEDMTALAAGAITLIALGGRQAWLGRRLPEFGLKPAPLAPLAVMLTLYAAACVWGPPLARAMIAATATLYCLHRMIWPGRPPAAFWGAALLAAPVLPSLQFYLGYPMRMASAALTTALLQLQGLPVERQGVMLAWGEQLVQFDAPCSGVRMLWAGLLFTLTLCAVYGLRPALTATAVAAALAMTVAGNAMRAASLFYLETGPLAERIAAFDPSFGQWGHEATGLAATGLTLGAMLLVLNGLAALDRRAG